jgi:hypothetical protein
MSRIRRHLTFANIASGIALFVALGGGTAVALNGTNTVQSDDLGPGAQVKAPDVAANAVNGSDVVDTSLTRADLAPSVLPKGRSTSSTCNPNTEAFADCGHVTIDLATKARVLIVASAQWYGNGAASIVGGHCRLGVNGAPFGPDAEPGELEDNSSNQTQQSLTLTAVTPPNLSPGPNTFGLACNQAVFSGDITFGPTYISAVVLGSG